MQPFTEPPIQNKEFYQALGLKVGLEVHQQLLTEKKLFCRCPAGLYSEEYDAEILRHMRPTLSELGEYDGTALMEFRTRKEIIYRLNNNSVCTYEMDDTPPFHIDPTAVDIAIQIALTLECNMVSEIHIARKQYLDGSIPTGFQRTTVVGLDGMLPVEDKMVHVIQLGLEEDACREVSDIGHDRIYLTDRLGMPLIEVVTAPELYTPYEAFQGAQAIRALTRSTGRVRTGGGAGREDVNVSITGGTRIEIKGVPRITRIPYLVHNEAIRQRSLLDIKEELKRRGYERDAIKESRVPVTKLLANTGFAPVRDAIDRNWEIQAVRLPGFAGLLKKEIQPGRPFLSEFSDRVRVVACLDRLPNVVCSDFAGVELSGAEWRGIMDASGAANDDAVILVWGTGKDLVTAVEELEARARAAFDGIPNETRQALRDNTNGFERVLPGPDRMYPDTDLPPKKITEEHLARVRSGIGLTGVEWSTALKEYSIGPHLALGLFKNGYAKLFLEIVRNHEVHPPFVASMLLDRFIPRLKRGEQVPCDEVIKTLFADHASGTLSKDAVKSWMSGSGSGDTVSPSTIRNDMLSSGEVEKELQRLAGQLPARCHTPQARKDFFIGSLKEKFYIDGSIVSKQLEQSKLLEVSSAKEK